MTTDELQAETMREAAAKVAEFTDRLAAELKNVKPLTPDQIDALAKQAHETDPDLIRTDAEIKQMQIVNSIFEKGDGRQ